MLLKERSDRTGLQTRLQELEERYRSTLEQLEQAHNRDGQHKRALRSLEDSVSQADALRVQQRAEEVTVIYKDILIVRTQRYANVADVCLTILWS